LFKLSGLTAIKFPSKAKNGVTYNSNYYFSTSHNRRRFNAAHKPNIEDVSLIKPYIEISNRLPTPAYESLKSGSELYCRFFNDFFNCFKTEVYGVSVAVSDSAKFKKQTHFVKLYDYIKNYWDNISDADKQFIKDASEVKNNSSSTFEFFKKLHYKNPECFPEISEILKKQKTVENDPRFKTMGNFIEFFNNHMINLDLLNKMITNLEEYRSDTIASFCQKQLQKYPLLNHLRDISPYSCVDYQPFLSECSNYVIAFDKQIKKTP